MSKKHHRKTPEIPQVGNALEVPNYVTPTTDLEYKRINDQVDRPDADWRTASPSTAGIDRKAAADPRIGGSCCP